MYKRLVIGDIHGISSWKEIYDKEKPEEVIILGDYFDSFTLSPEVQLLNFNVLLETKKNHDLTHNKKFILLMGNHDYHYLKDTDEQYSGYNQFIYNNVNTLLGKLIDDNDISIVYIDSTNKIIFSHAGVSQKWFDEYVMTELFAINTIALSSLKFTYRDGGDWYGSSEYSSPIWIRPEGLLKKPYRDYYLNTWNQIYGHTHIQQPTKFMIDDSFFIDLDCLINGYYMIQKLDDKDKLITQEFKNWLN